MSDAQMTAARFEQIEREGGWVDLSDRAKFRLTGADRVRFLNGQVTNDVRAANACETIYACVTDIKGRIAGDVFIHAAAQEDALLIDAEPTLREVLGPRLERYIIADDVALSDVTDEWRLWHAFGRAAESADSMGGGTIRVKSDRLGNGGLDIWFPVTASISPPCAPGSVLSAEEFEVLRILRGVPRFPNELNGDIFPPEAALDDRAMSYTKGCYIGQEILSRIRTTGKMPRELVRWTAAGQGGGIARGSRVFLPGAGVGAEVGMITSITEHPLLERPTGLAYLKRGSAVVDSELPVGSDAPTIALKIKISPILNQ